MTIYFLGGGNMAAALIGGLRQNLPQETVHVVNRGEAKRLALAERFGITASAVLPPLQADDVLVLAVKPQDMQTACSGIDTAGALVVSVAAGLPLARLSQWLGGTQRIIRAMPNTPSRIGMGVSGLYAAADTVQTDRVRAEQIFAVSGEVVWLEKEEEMHTLAAISGSGPAYVFYLLDALQQAAQQQGFDEATARRLSLAVFRGAAALAEQDGGTFAALQDQVTSKGGTTIAALNVFRSKALAEGLAEGVAAAVARSQEMARSL